jgi:hypothetical protein
MPSDGSVPSLDRMLMEPDFSEPPTSGHVIGAATFILLIAYLVFSSAGVLAAP